MASVQAHLWRIRLQRRLRGIISTLKINRRFALKQFLYSWSNYDKKPETGDDEAHNLCHSSHLHGDTEDGDSEYATLVEHNPSGESEDEDDDDGPILQLEDSIQEEYNMYSGAISNNTSTKRKSENPYKSLLREYGISGDGYESEPHTATSDTLDEKDDKYDPEIHMPVQDSHIPDPWLPQFLQHDDDNDDDDDYNPWIHYPPI